MTFSRRQFLAAAGTTVAAGATYYTWRIEPHRLDVVMRRLPVRGLPGRLAGRTLLQLSDIHVGPRVDDDYVRSVFARAGALRPDIVAVTGDLVSYHDDVFTQMARVYQSFPRGRLATLGILGNHDYGPSWSHPEIAEQVVDIAGRCGMTMLRNQVLDVDGLQVVGFDDLWAARFDAAAGLGDHDPGQAAIALSHNPDTVDLPGWDRFKGWVLSGHTHGGQCKPPFLPPPLLPVRNRRYTQGEFALDGQRRLYINRGVGHLIPVRFNVRPEITLFELTPV